MAPDSTATTSIQLYSDILEELEDQSASWASIADSIHPTNPSKLSKSFKSSTASFAHRDPETLTQDILDLKIKLNQTLWEKKLLTVKLIKAERGRLQWKKAAKSNGKVPTNSSLLSTAKSSSKSNLDNVAFMKKSIRTYQGKVRGLEEEKKMLNSQIEQRETDLKNARAEVARLAQDLKNQLTINAKEQSSKAELIKVKKELKELKEQHESSQQGMQQRDDERNEQEQLIESLKAQAVAYRKRIRQLEQELDGPSTAPSSKGAESGDESDNYE